MVSRVELATELDEGIATILDRPPRRVRLGR
jgi:hypothetical protein